MMETPGPANVKGNVKANAKAKGTYAPFEVADYLDSEEAIAEYLSLAARDETPAYCSRRLVTWPRRAAWRRSRRRPVSAGKAFTRR
jgi:hypothetical protein